MIISRLSFTQSCAVAVFALGASAVWTETAFARPLVCDQLETEFIELSQQMGNSGVSDNSWQTAYNEQLMHIQNVESQMFNFGCDGSFGPPQCQQLSGSLQQMNENLAYLDTQRQQELYTSSLQNRLREVEQTLQDLNCASLPDQQIQQQTPLPGQANQQFQPQAPVPDQPNQQFQPQAPVPGQTDQQFQPQTPPPAQANQPMQLEPRSNASVTSGGQQYATMCVRKCDGYYFPINPNSGAEDLAEDEEICQALCPTQDTELYVFQVPQESPAQMRSLAGAPYTSLANAYEFRQQSNPACSCDAAGGQPGGQLPSASLPSLDQAIPGNDLEDLTPGATATYPAIPLESERRQTADATEAQSDNPEPPLVQQKFVPHEVEPRTGPIRKVGPKFFPDR